MVLATQVEPADSIDLGRGLAMAVGIGLRFAGGRQGRLMPAVGELGDRAFPSPPERKEFPVHSYTKP